MRILALNGASAAAGVGVGLLELEGGRLRIAFEATQPGRDGAGLPVLLQRSLDALRWPAAQLDLLAVVVGPGSFTGLRATLAVAHGLALGGRAEVVGVTVGEALAPGLRAVAGPGRFWCVSQARRGRVFIERPDDGVPVQAAFLDALTLPDRPVLLGGDASDAVADVLGRAAIRSGLLGPTAAAVAGAALARRGHALPPLPAQPLYVDPPEARPPEARLAETGLPETRLPGNGRHAAVPA